MNLRFRAWHKERKKMYNVKGIDWSITTGGIHGMDMLHLVEIDIPDHTGFYCRINEIDLILY